MTPPYRRTRPLDWRIDKHAYYVAKAKAGILEDQEVARRLGINRVTWSEVVNGHAGLSPAVRAGLRTLFPDDYDHIVRPK
jgi:hypothetical protein